MLKTVKRVFCMSGGGGGPRRDVPQPVAVEAAPAPAPAAARAAAPSPAVNNTVNNNTDTVNNTRQATAQAPLSSPGDVSLTAADRAGLVATRSQAVAQKRLMKEFKALSSSKWASDGVFSVELVGDNLSEWSVRLYKFDADSRALCGALFLVVFFSLAIIN